MIGKLLVSRSGMFFIGVATAGLVKNAAPAIGRALRPAIRETIRLGMVASREIGEMAESAREELEDITAEARAEDEADTNKKSDQAD